MSTDTIPTTTVAGDTMAGVTEYAHMLLKVSDIERSERLMSETFSSMWAYSVTPAIVSPAAVPPAIVSVDMINPFSRHP